LDLSLRTEWSYVWVKENNLEGSQKPERGKICRIPKTGSNSFRAWHTLAYGANLAQRFLYGLQANNDLTILNDQEKIERKK